MPDEPKKNDKKNAKEQRKPRQRHQGKSDKKSERPEEPNSAPKVTVPQKPPVYESPPPEFYKNLKRETDEILKITEEENVKYKKKEIQSNWSKYEIPIESYEEIDQQENLGADYEKLIEAPLSVGGHFQFKHEKSWDLNTGPSLYDKYFDINMEDLNIALCTIPFYERNNIEQTVFSESELLTMNNRLARFKQKYYNDKSYSTPETEAQDRLEMNLRSLISDASTVENTSIEAKDNIKMPQSNRDLKDSSSIEKDINIELKSETVISVNSNKIEENIDAQSLSTIEAPTIKSNVTADNDKHGDFIFGNTERTLIVDSITESEAEKVKPITEIQAELQNDVEKSPPMECITNPIDTTLSSSSDAKSSVETKKNPVIESPEDLEKWLDDFLDG